jgi:hypothetical protein
MKLFTLLFGLLAVLATSVLAYVSLKYSRIVEEDSNMAVHPVGTT